MAQALRAAGVRAIEELKTGDAEEAVAWATRRDDWPVVVKPVDSAGTDGVALCETPEAIRAVFAETIGRPNALHGTNEQLLVQELLRGTQLFTDSISWDGVHHVSECWRDNEAPRRRGVRLRLRGAARPARRAAGPGDPVRAQRARRARRQRTAPRTPR